MTRKFSPAMCGGIPITYLECRIDLMDLWLEMLQDKVVV